jgi:hypothetical protein
MHAGAVPQSQTPRSVVIGLALVLALAAGVGVLLKTGDDGQAGRLSGANSIREGGARLYCGDRRFPFRELALIGDAKAEAQATDPAVVLRKFLAVERMPQTGWRLLAQHSAAVFFGNGSASSGAISYVIVERHETWGPGYTLPRQGSWGVAGWGGCYLRRYTPSLDTAEWILADRGPASNAQQFIALVHISGCFGGRPTPLGDIHKPEIRYRRDEVAITFFAEFKPPGSYTCQGSPPTPYKVTLSEPLDARRLLDGSWFPPRPPTPSPGRRP